MTTRKRKTRTLPTWFPAASTCLIEMLWFLPLPGAALTFVVNGDVHGENMPPSTLHWKVTPGVLARKVRRIFAVLCFVRMTRLLFLCFFLRVPTFVPPAAGGGGGPGGPVGSSTAPMSVPSSEFATLVSTVRGSPR